MQIKKEAMNRIDPYIYGGYEPDRKGMFHPSKWNLTVNTYAVKKAETFEQKDVLLYSPIDYLFPILENKYLLGLYTIFTLLERGHKITLVSASDSLMDLILYTKKAETKFHFKDLTEEMIKDNIKIIFPIPFFDEELYETYEPAMPNYAYRLRYYGALVDNGFVVEPAFLNVPEFADDTSEVKHWFYDEYEDLLAHDADFVTNSFVYGKEKRDLWDIGEKLNKREKVEGDDLPRRIGSF